MIIFPLAKTIRRVSMIAILAPAAIPLVAQGQNTLMALSPANPTDRDIITFTLSGTWPNTCIPQSPVVSVSLGKVAIDTSNPSPVCAQVLTAWTLTGTIGKLPAGTYDTVARHTGPSADLPIELARQALTVAGSSQLNEVVLPIVVNGALAEKEYYQTIFTVLNTSLQDVQATLQVYSNAGFPVGAFCSPIAPPPASLTFTLNPNQQFFQFTSADLPFLNGWARLTWEGSPSILVSQELTLAAAVPSPCKLVCNLPSTQKLSSAQITAIKPARQFTLPVTINQYRQTALALINPSSTETVTVEVSILDQSGKSAQFGVPGHFFVTIRPLERISNFLWQMALEESPLTVIVNPPDSFQGSVILNSASSFVVSALNIMYPEGKFVPAPALSTSP